MKIVVTGATGFVGNHTVKALTDAGHCVVGVARTQPQGARRVEGAEYYEGVDVGDSATMKPEYFEGAEAVVHLVGIIQERSGGQTFKRIHVNGTRNVLAAATAAKTVRKFVYQSAIGADKTAQSVYSQTKAMAEDLVTSGSLPYTILRPSIILGKDGEFVSQISDLVHYGGLPVKIPFPIIPIPGSGRNLFQPIYIDDLMGCIVGSVNPNIALNSTIEVGGDTQVSFNALISGFAAALKVRKPHVHAPISILKIVAVFMSVLPNPPLTTDQLKNLSRDNICDLSAMRAVFGVDPIGFDEAIQRVFA